MVDSSSTQLITSTLPLKEIFLKNSVMFVRGPNGTMSLQTMSDIQRLLNSLIELNTMVTEENPAFLPEVDLHSLLTLLVENLFAEMRGGSKDTPQLLDFARRFSSSSRELMKGY